MRRGLLHVIDRCAIIGDADQAIPNASLIEWAGAARIIALSSCPMRLVSDQPIPNHDYFFADKLTLIGVEAGLIAVERDDLKVRDVVNLHSNLSYGSTTFPLRIAAKYITARSWNI